MRHFNFYKLLQSNVMYTNILCLVWFGSDRNKLAQLLIRARNIFARTVRSLLEILRYFLWQKCRPKNQVFSDIYHLRQYWQGITPSESIKVRHFPLTSKNWTITWRRCKVGGKLLLIISNRKSYIGTKIGDREWPWTA